MALLELLSMKLDLTMLDGNVNFDRLAGMVLGSPLCPPCRVGVRRASIQEDDGTWPTRLTTVQDAEDSMLNDLQVIEHTFTAVDE